MKIFGSIQWRIAALKNGFLDATAYRWEFLFEILGAAFVPAAIQMVLWYAMYKVGGNEVIAGLTYSEMIQYTIASVLFSQVRGGDHDFEIQEMIRSGGLSQYLLRPVGVVEFVYLRGVAPKLFIAGLGLVVAISFNIYWGIAWWRPIGAMVLALLGNIIHYQLGAALATTAFYWEEAFSVLMVKNLVVSILCGELIPLHLFPDSMKWLWKITPFYLYVFGPVEFMLGRWSVQDLIWNMTIGLFWILAAWFMIFISWRFGLKRYLSLGG